MNDDNLTMVAEDLEQLASEIAGNESRPSATDIVARLKQVASRLRDLQSAAQPTTTPLTRSYQAVFQPGQPIVGTHPRLAASAQGDGDDGGENEA